MPSTITLRHLKHFRMVAEEQNFHRAAERIPTDPSSLSRTIHELEVRLGVELFVREPRGLRITPAGDFLLAQSMDLLGSFEHVVREVRQVHAKQRLPLRVGIADGLAQPLLIQRLAAWRTIVPRAALHIIELRASELATALRREEVDVGFSFGVPAAESIVQEPAWTYPLVVLVPAGHPLAHGSEVTMRELVGYPLVVCDPSSKPGAHWQIGGLIERHMRAPEIGGHATNLTGLIIQVGSGAGIGLVDAGHMLTVNHPDIVAVPLREVGASLTTFVVYRKRKSELPETLVQFLNLAKAASP